MVLYLGSKHPKEMLPLSLLILNTNGITSFTNTTENEEHSYYIAPSKWFPPELSANSLNW